MGCAGGRARQARLPTRGTRQHAPLKARFARQTAQIIWRKPRHLTGVRAPYSPAWRAAGKRRWGRGKGRARSGAVSMVHKTTIAAPVARPVELCMRSVRRSTGLGSGAGAPTRLPRRQPGAAGSRQNRKSVRLRAAMRLFMRSLALACVSALTTCSPRAVAPRRRRRRSRRRSCRWATPAAGSRTRAGAW